MKIVWADKIKKALEEEAREYACVMARVPDVQGTLEAMRESIDPEDIYEGEDPGEPHVTVLYGFQDGQLGEVKKKLEEAKPFTVKIKDFELFEPEGEEYDVIVLRVESPELVKLHDELAKLPHESTHPEYKPHLTLAYVKKGQGERYTNPETSPFWTYLAEKRSKPWIVGRQRTVDTVVVSEQSGGEEEVKLSSGLPEKLANPVARAMAKVNKGHAEDEQYAAGVHINHETGAAWVDHGDWENEDNGYAPLEELYSAIKAIPGVKSVDGESEAPPQPEEGPWEKIEWRPKRESVMKNIVGPNDLTSGKSAVGGESSAEEQSPLFGIDMTEQGEEYAWDEVEEALNQYGLDVGRVYGAMKQMFKPMPLDPELDFRAGEVRDAVKYAGYDDGEARDVVRKLRQMRQSVMTGVAEATEDDVKDALQPVLDRANRRVVNLGPSPGAGNFTALLDNGVSLEISPAGASGVLGDWVVVVNGEAFDPMSPRGVEDLVREIESPPVGEDTYTSDVAITDVIPITKGGEKVVRLPGLKMARRRRTKRRYQKVGESMSRGQTVVSLVLRPGEVGELDDKPVWGALHESGVIQVKPFKMGAEEFVEVKIDTQRKEWADANVSALLDEVGSINPTLQSKIQERADPKDVAADVENWVQTGIFEYAEAEMASPSSKVKEMILAAKLRGTVPTKEWLAEQLFEDSEAVLELIRLREPSDAVMEELKKSPTDVVVKAAELHFKEAERSLTEMTDEEQDTEAEEMLKRYNAEPTSLWLYTNLPITERMAWAYLAADEFKGAPYEGDEVRRFVRALKEVVASPETFWEQVAAKDRARAVYLQEMDWSVEKVPLDEVGVYPHFGGFPREWSRGNLLTTAEKLAVGTERPERRHSVLEMTDQWMTILKFLPPILVEGGTLRGQRPEAYEATKWDVDDGNHRLVAAAIGGAREAVCFVGRRKAGEDPEDVQATAAKGEIGEGEVPGDHSKALRGDLQKAGLHISASYRDRRKDHIRWKFRVFATPVSDAPSSITGEVMSPKQAKEADALVKKHFPDAEIASGREPGVRIYVVREPTSVESSAFEQEGGDLSDAEMKLLKRLFSGVMKSATASRQGKLSTMYSLRDKGLVHKVYREWHLTGKGAGKVAGMVEQETTDPAANLGMMGDPSGSTIMSTMEQDPEGVTSSSTWQPGSMFKLHVLGEGGEGEWVYREVVGHEGEGEKSNLIYKTPEGRVMRLRHEQVDAALGFGGATGPEELGVKTGEEPGEEEPVPQMGEQAPMGQPQETPETRGLERDPGFARAITKYHRTKDESDWQEVRKEAQRVLGVAGPEVDRVVGQYSVKEDVIMKPVGEAQAVPGTRVVVNVYPAEGESLEEIDAALSGEFRTRIWAHFVEVGLVSNDEALAKQEVEKALQAGGISLEKAGRRFEVAEKDFKGKKKTVSGREVEEPTHLKALAKKAGVSLDKALTAWGEAQKGFEKAHPDIKKGTGRYYKGVTGFMKARLGLKTKPVGEAVERFTKDAEFNSLLNRFALTKNEGYLIRATSRAARVAGIQLKEARELVDELLKTVKEAKKG